MNSKIARKPNTRSDGRNRGSGFFGSPLKKAQLFKPGDAVKSEFKMSNGKHVWCMGSILSVTGDEDSGWTYDVRFEDGETLRLPSKHLHLRLPISKIKTYRYI